MVKEKLRIVSLPVDDGGCGWYRIRQNFKAMESTGQAKPLILKASDSIQDIQTAIENADVVIGRNGTSLLVQGIRKAGLEMKFVFDHDDNTFEILPSNEHYKDHGTNDITANTPEGDIDVWKTGVHGFDRFVNRHKSIDLQYLVETASICTAPTKRLADLWGSMNDDKKSAVIPNLIDFNLYPDVKVDTRKGKEIRVGWQGGVSHMGDFGEIGESISNVMLQNDNVSFYSLGSAYKNFFHEKVQSRVKNFPWVAFQAHPYRMKMMDLDIAVIPLQDALFNTYKSEVKFSEFAALKIPCLVKNMSPYSEVIKDGVTGLLYDTKEEAEEYLNELVGNKDLRDRLVKNAYEWVRANRDMDKWAVKLVDFYRSVK